MEKRSFKSPLTVYVAYHQQYAEGGEVYDFTYHLLCRNSDRPQDDGLDIPVFLRTGGDGVGIAPINFAESHRTAVILLIDGYMFRDAGWHSYIKGMMKDLPDNVRLYPVALCKYANEFVMSTMGLQSIKLDSYSIMENQDMYAIRLMDDLIRQLRGNDVHIVNRLFISHSKRDDNREGLKYAESLRDNINHDTKLSTFFDQKSIVDAYDFADQIEEAASNSMLVIVNTCTYAQREWCKKEVITAKNNNVPIVCVDLLSGVVDRTFPYMSNIPAISKPDDWKQVVRLLLSTALRQYYVELLLPQLVKEEKRDTTVTMAVAPELFTVCRLNPEIKTVIYSEPPVSKDELQVLLRPDKNRKFITPMQVLADGEFLGGKNIAISVSMPQDATLFGVGAAMFHDVSVELARHILAAGGKLVYGGDLRPDGFTAALGELTYQYASKADNDITHMYMTNYVAAPYCGGISEEDEETFYHNRVRLVKCAAPSADADVAECLSSMRRQMEDDVIARIVMGGKTEGFKGSMPGIIEEATLSVQMEHPLYVLGGFGGAARQIVEDHPEITHNLHNGLSEEENHVLFASANVIEIIALILKGLKKSLK